MNREQTYQTLYVKKKKESLEKYRAYPALHWAMKYHRNTRNEPMSFKGMYYLLALYKMLHEYQRIAIEKAVQTGVSEMFIVESHYYAKEGLTVFYVLPKYELRNRFVNNRIHRQHRRIGYYANLVRQARLEGGSHRTSLMHFGNGTIAYVGSNVEDEFLEIPVDVAYVDEKDRCNQRNLLMVPDRFTASPYKIWREASNPTVEGFGIDERYLSSTQGKWMLKCDRCNEHFVPDFFEHVVREVGINQYEARDPQYVPFEREARLIHNCGRPIDRLKQGEWVHEYADREWVGIRVSKLFNKHASLSDLTEEWKGLVGHELKEQIFFNSNLGLPFSSEGAKIHEHHLDSCKRSYQYPADLSRAKFVRVMGVDVGAALHIIIRERCIDRGGQAQRLLLAVSIATFSELYRLIRQWHPKVIVVDAYPEIHEVSTLKKKFNNVWASRFQEQKLEMSRNKKDRIVVMDRTAILDFVKKAIDEQFLLLPKTADTIDKGSYYSHMQASTRVLEVNETDLEKSRFVWKHSKPDHYFLAEAYCMQADFLVPKSSVFDFYKSEVKKMHDVEFDSDKMLQQTHGGVVSKKKAEELQRATPEQFLQDLDRTMTVRPSISRNVEAVNIEILRIANELCASSEKGTVTLQAFATASGLRGDNSREFLLSHGFEEKGTDTFVKDNSSSKKDS